jgi:hypothetical protein
MSLFEVGAVGFVGFVGYVDFVGSVGSPKTCGRQVRLFDGAGDGKTGVKCLYLLEALV